MDPGDAGAREFQGEAMDGAVREADGQRVFVTSAVCDEICLHRFGHPASHCMNTKDFVTEQKVIFNCYRGNTCISVYIWDEQ